MLAGSMMCGQAYKTCASLATSKLVESILILDTEQNKIMVNQIQSRDISELRKIVAQIVSENSLSGDNVEAAREAIQARIQEARIHGLTPADVIRAILTPVFELQDDLLLSSRHGLEA